MQLKFRAKLLLIVGTTALAFVVLIIGGWIIGERWARELGNVEGQLVPKLELGPRVELKFDHLRQGLQEAVAAQDPAALEATVSIRDELLALIASSPAVERVDADSARAAVDDYYIAARDVSRRLIAGETGEAVVDAVNDMQAKQQRAISILKPIVSLSQTDLAQGFHAVRSSAESELKFRLAIGISCFIVVLALSLWMSRGLLDALGSLSDGFARFATGDFSHRIQIRSSDEIGKVAAEANQMAESLLHLANQRDHDDWLRTGLAGLSDELRGDLTVDEAARRAVLFLMTRLDAVAGAVYLKSEDGAFQVRARCAFGAADTDARIASFGVGVGLVGRAALGKDILVIEQPPPDYLRVGSALGDAAPRELVFLPLIRAGNVSAVLELAFFQPMSSRARELLSRARDALAVTFEAASSRAALGALLDRTREQTERLAAQEEELLQSNQELRMQQDELHGANEELRLQREALERQNVSLEETQLRLQENAAQLEETAAKLEKTSSYKSQFLANMSHELRTPLNSILLLSQLLAENKSKNLTETQVEHAVTIYGSGKDLLDLINQVLDLAKIEAGKQEIRVEQVRLEALVDHVRRMFAPLAQEKKLRFAVEIAADLPATIDTEGGRVERILVNLLGNAIKFTERGEVILRVARLGPESTVSIAGREIRQAIAISVTDTGPGIPAEVQELIFAPFEQVESRSDRRYGGTGLGLAIARESARLLGGDLLLSSEVGRGSTFTCYLPERASPATTANGSTRSAARRPIDQRIEVDIGPARKAREDLLLIVEDDPMFAKQLAELARDRGLATIVAATGTDGLRLARERQPSGVVLDVKLPDIDGWEVLARLRSDPTTQSIPVHFISGVEAAERGLSLGAIGYLTKPVTPDDLAGVLDALCPSPVDAQKVLVIEDDAVAGRSLLSLLGEAGIQARRVANGEEALKAIAQARYGCILLDLGLPDMDGLELLERIQAKGDRESPPIVVHTGRALTKVEARRLDEYAQAVVLKDGSADSRLLDEVRLFLRHIDGGARIDRHPADVQVAADVSLGGTRILLVDDDMRTVYALSAMLRGKGAEVVVAVDGREALDVLARDSKIAIVLMDVMMPEMDGYEAMRRIRKEDRFARLPVVALTAKAMKGERERCIEAGANDYLAKPVDVNRLLSVLQKWKVQEPLDVGQGS